jgi:hypothetical protein
VLVAIRGGRRSRDHGNVHRRARDGGGASTWRTPFGDRHCRKPSCRSRLIWRRVRPPGHGGGLARACPTDLAPPFRRMVGRGTGVPE